MASILDLRNISAKNAMIPILTFVVLAVLYRTYRRPRTTKLRGPPSKGFLVGVMKDHFNSSDLGCMYGNWEKTYGPVYEIPSSLGSTILVLQDPKAITHLFSKDTTTYHQNKVSKALFKNHLKVSPFDGSFRAILSRSFDGKLNDVLVVTEGETHKRLVLRIYIHVMSADVLDVWPDNGELYQLLSRMLPLVISPRSF